MLQTGPQIINEIARMDKGCTANFITSLHIWELTCSSPVILSGDHALPPF